MEYWQEQLLRAWLLSKKEGFSLLEVLVGIIVITVFTITTMQALVIGTAFRVRAEQSSGANSLIQEEIESAKFAASQIGSSAGDCDAETSDDGYAFALANDLPDDNGNSVDIGDTSFNVLASTQEFPGQDLWLLRNTNITDDDPHVLELEYVVVLDDNGYPSNDEKDIVVQTYTEVIPDEAFNC